MQGEDNELDALISRIDFVQDYKDFSSHFFTNANENKFVIFIYTFVFLMRLILFEQ